MLRIRAFKYLFIWTGVAAGMISLQGAGWWSYALPIYAFGIIPLLELTLRSNGKNLDHSSNSDADSFREPDEIDRAGWLRVYRRPAGSHDQNEQSGHPVVVLPLPESPAVKTDQR